MAQPVKRKRDDGIKIEDVDDVRPFKVARTMTERQFEHDDDNAKNTLAPLGSSWQDRSIDFRFGAQNLSQSALSFTFGLSNNEVAASRPAYHQTEPIHFVDEYLPKPVMRKTNSHVPDPISASRAYVQALKQGPAAAYAPKKTFQSARQERQSAFAKQLET